MHRLLKVLGYCFALTLPLITSAQPHSKSGGQYTKPQPTSSTGLQHNSAREKFVQLEKQLSRVSSKQVDSVFRTAAALKDYPLYPYLEQAYLRRKLHISHRDSFEHFFVRYQGQPVATSLRKQWLRYLARAGHQQAFIASYQPHLGTKITCYYLNYQLKNSQRVDSWSADIERIWLHGDSQPKECDPVFKRWKDSGLMHADAVLGRIELVVKANNLKLINYLKRRLPEPQRYLADLWRHTRLSASYVKRGTRFPMKHPQQESKILAYGIERLAWQDPHKAIQSYYQWKDKASFTPLQFNGIHRAIALSLTLDKDPLAPEWLAKADVSSQKEDVKRWHMAHRLEQQQWAEVLSVIKTASPAKQRDSAFRYWKARSLGELNAAQLSSQLLSELAVERSYYGFLSSARLSQVPSIRHLPAQSDSSLRQQLAVQPAAQRAFELRQLGRWVEARREWYGLVRGLNKVEMREAALLASDWGWYDQAIIGFAKSGYLDDVDRRFPLAFAPEFSKQGDVHGVDTAFALAIARRESSFMVDAVSPAGAKGLMQLMPGTAQYIGREKVSKNGLFEPERNVAYGVKYLRYLMDKMGDNPVLVSASYNAGWRRVVEWLPQGNQQATDIWIENIPYRETRHYVKAVLAYRHIYEQQLGTPSTLFDQLAQSPIPSASMLNGSPLDGAQLAPK